MNNGFEGTLVYGTPAGVVGKAGLHRDLSRGLRRDDVDHVALHRTEIRLQSLRGGVHPDDTAACRAGAPFDHAGVELFPAFHEQGLFGKLLLGVKDDDFRLRLVCLEVPGDQAGTLVWAGWAAERIRRRRYHHRAAIGHGFKLLAQQRGLRSCLPGVRHRQ